MTDPRTPSRWVLPLLVVVLLAVAAAAGWWFAAGRPVPPEETARADAWLRTEALLDAPALASLPTDREEAVRADLTRQLEALGPAPDDRAIAAARAQRPSAALAPDAGEPLGSALRASAAALADDALSTRDPALARVLAAVAASRATTAGQPAPSPAGPGLCAPGEEPAPAEAAGEGPAAGAVLWSALDRAGYALEALAARGELAPAGSPSTELLHGAQEDLEELLEAPAARRLLEAEPGLPAGAYVLPGTVSGNPEQAAGAVALDVQEAAAHVLGHGDAGARCWALSALERASGLRAGLTGEVDALPGIAVDGDAPR